jgi:hypothetical protein
MQLVIGHLDVRPILPAISAPTLVLLHKDNQYMPALFGRYLAEHIADATLVELEGGDHLYRVGNPDATLNEIEQFATGTRAQPIAERVLATVLFTDIAVPRAGRRSWEMNVGLRCSNATISSCADNSNASGEEK